MNKDKYNELVKEGAWLVGRGNVEEAIVWLTRLTKDSPNPAAAYLVLGDIIWGEKRLDEAEEVFQLAIKKHPKLEIASKGRFHALWESERYEDALAEIRRFMEISDSEDYRKIVREINEKWDSEDGK